MDHQTQTVGKIDLRMKDSISCFQDELEQVDSNLEPHPAEISLTEHSSTHSKVIWKGFSESEYGQLIVRTQRKNWNQWRVFDENH